MSKLETPMTRRYWERVRGTLLEEYLIVPSRPGVGRRMIDAVIIEDGDHRIASRGKTVSLDGHDIVVVQTKASRLGMYLLGQAFFSRELIMDRFAPCTSHHVDHLHRDQSWSCGNRHKPCLFQKSSVTHRGEGRNCFS
jgi:hypothetical protein